MPTLAGYGFVIALGRDNDGRIVASAEDPAGETWQMWAAIPRDS